MIHANLSMKINAKPADLVAALEHNKAAHREEYEKALGTWFEKLGNTLAELLTAAEAREVDRDYADPIWRLTKPVDNTELYDKYIGMFTMATDETIEISSEDYGCVVDDNWDWAVSAKATNSSYAVGSARRR